MYTVCGCVPKILQKRINFPTFVVGGEGVKGGGKTGKELFPPYELFFEGIPYKFSGGRG